MDSHIFGRMANELDSKIGMIDEFVQRAHKEGISTIEAVAMQNHVRREFSTKQRSAFRQQIAGLYRGGNITIEQKERMDNLLDRASKIADEHFLRLSRIVPEGRSLDVPRGMPGLRQGESGGRKLLRLFGLKDAA